MSLPSLRSSAPVALAAIFVEKYFLSLVFLYFGYRQARDAQVVLTALATETTGASLANLASHSLICALQVVAGLALIFNRVPERLPEHWKEILVPMIGTFFYLSYNFITAWPAGMQQILAPAEARGGLALGAVLLSCAGFAIALWGAAFLGRSFAVLVAVRQVVRDGPYRYVRHPIYAGYALHLVSLVLATPSPAMMLLVSAHLGLNIWRAYLEEASLQMHSEAYRRYAEETGFLTPRLGRSAGASARARSRVSGEAAVKARL